jgi:hypothetical protein
VISTYPVIPWKAENVSKRDPDHTYTVCIVPVRGALVVRVRVADAVIEATVLFLQISDHLLLVPLEPASDHRDQDMENHSHSSGWKP